MYKTVDGSDRCAANCNYEMCKYHVNQGLAGTPQNLEEANECKKYKEQDCYWEDDDDYLYLMVESRRGMLFEEPIATINKSTKEYKLSQYLGNIDIWSIHDYDHYFMDDSIDELKKRIYEWIQYELACQIERMSYVLGCINRGIIRDFMPDI